MCCRWALLISFLSFTAFINAATPSELENKAFALSLPVANELTTNQWYVMYNIGRKGFLCDDESKLYVTTAPPSPEELKYLVRFVEKSGKVYIQTGRGRYFSSLSTSNNSGTTTTTKTAYTFGTIEEGFFWLKDAAGMVLDANALSADITSKATVAGWGTTTPNSSTGNNSWRFFPAELIDTSGDIVDLPYSIGRFSIQSAENGKFLHLDAYNAALGDEEAQGSIVFKGVGTWEIGMPDGTDAKPSLHIGTEGKFSAGPTSPCHIYRALPLGDDDFSYVECASIVEGYDYLLVANYEGADYALLAEVVNPATSNQRILSSKINISDEGVITFEGSKSPRAHHWNFHYGESLVQPPFVYKPGETGGASGNGKPLLTIACLSDIHTQDGWLCSTEYDDQQNGIHTPLTIANVKVRESAVETAKLLQQEQVDVVIVGGDCQSDATIDEEHWRQVRRMMANTLRGVGNGAESFPVLYVNGNHEYEVANNWGGATGGSYYNWRSTRPFNAGEYYDFPMLGDVGVLAAERDCFYEDCPNALALNTKNTMRVLAAYHYNIKGFDFVVLNCAKHLFHNANNYTYSDESVAWVERKLRELYADDPTGTKTVFFALHIPFGDSNSINTTEDKGMSYYPSTSRLKQVLAQYPGIIMLYGHDHGKDNAYIRKNTAQRITRYDSNGCVIPTIDGTTTFNKDLSTSTPYRGQSAFFHPYSGKTENYLGIKGGFNASNSTVTRTLALLDYPASITLFPEADNAVSLRLGDGSEHLCFSNNTFQLTATDHQPLQLYRVDIDGSTFTATAVQAVNDGDICLIAAGGRAYKVGATKVFNPAEANSLSSFATYLWRAEVPSDANASFISSFMGSMRYYANACGEPGNSTQAERKLVQGLLIYIYPDRIVFDMKNFRNKVTSRVKSDLCPFVVRRTTEALPSDAIVTPNPSHAQYRRVESLDQLCDQAVCLLVDESKPRAVGIASNSTQKFTTLGVNHSDDHTILFNHAASDCEFTLERYGDAWFLRSHDGYLKSADAHLYHRQQPDNFFTGLLLDNEAHNARLEPWTIELGADAEAHIVGKSLGAIQQYVLGLSTTPLHLYQKVIPADFSSSSLTTFYAEHAIAPTPDVEAYTIGGLTSEGQLHFVRYLRSLPAKTGMLLRRTATLSDTGETLLPVIDDRYATPLDNLLHGTLSTITVSTPLNADGEAIAATYYTFDTDTESFIPAASSPYVNPAGNAYLMLSADEAQRHDEAPAMPLDVLLQQADVLGIHPPSSSLLPSSVQTQVFNLAGQRVNPSSTSKLAPGIYVANGRKIIIR